MVDILDDELSTGLVTQHNLFCDDDEESHNMVFEDLFKEVYELTGFASLLQHPIADKPEVLAQINN